jgi:hypothetical protein
MTISHLEILVEEPSMEAAMRLLVPKIVGRLSFEVYPYQGKADLLGKLPDRLRGYARWIPSDWRIVVVIDRDDKDCHDLKKDLETEARKAGLSSRTQSGRREYKVVNRLAIEELEAWYFGDWEAVCSAYPRANVRVPNKRRYRDPDAITGGTWEALEKELKQAGLFKTGLRKIEAAKAIAQHMDPWRNRSRSFCVFRDALAEIVQ